MMMQLTECVAAGLRNMEDKPKAMLFLDDATDWTWDRDSICGLPVYKVVGLTSCYDSYTTKVIPFVPLVVDIVQYRRFVDGYEEVGE